MSDSRLVNKLNSLERTVQTLETEVISLKQQQKADKTYIKSLEEKIELLEERATNCDERIQDLKKLHGMADLLTFIVIYSFFSCLCFTFFFLGIIY
jgi:chromosome segregation ATPase